jgi:dephospho-CoA kinase
MKRPLLIGVTGGIGSGKSLVTRIFSTLGVPIYDADSRAKRLMNTDPVLIAEIKKEFGEAAYREDGILNRDFLASTVFNNEEKLKKLNQLVHPRVQLDTEVWVKENENKRYLIKEAALLFESGANKFLDKVIVVTAPEELRKQRVLTRDTRSPQEVNKIMLNQMKEEDKVQRADFVIKNDESELVIPQVLKLHERFNTSVNN